MESIVTLELLGNLKAIQFSITNLSNSNIAIFTDSKTSLSLLKGYTWSYKVLVDQILSCFKICLSRKINSVFTFSGSLVTVAFQGMSLLIQLQKMHTVLDA